MICELCQKEYEWHFNSKYCSDVCKHTARVNSKRKYHKTEKWKEAMKRWHKNPKRIETEKRYHAKEETKRLNNERVKKNYHEKLKNNPEYKEKRRKMYEKYVEENIDKVREIRRNAGKKYRKTELWKIVLNLGRHKRRVVQRSEDAITKEEWLEILSNTKWCCKFCWSNERIEMDHIIPISKWWRHTRENLQPLCRSCNAKKNDIIIYNL